MDVMFVDDEILAIEHIKNMIDWESGGFRVIAEATNPMKAIELFKKTGPQLVFADIKMPGMDGISFSRKILSINPHVKIVLLTSYKEFEYAQAAVEIGAINYLLKHEINANKLVNELEKIKTEWERENRRDTMMKRQLLKEALLGNLRENEQAELETSFKLEDHSQFVLFLAGVAKPFSLLSRNEPPFMDEEYALVLEEMRLLESLPVTSDVFVMLASFPKGLSERARRGLLLAELLVIQKTISAQSDLHVNVVASHAFTELAMLPENFQKAKFVLQQAIFDGMYKCRLVEDATTFDPLPQQSYHVFLEESLKHLQAQQYEEMLTALQQCFDTVLQAADFVALNDVCDRWISGLDMIRESHGLPVVEVLMKQGVVVASAQSATEVRDIVVDLTRLSIQQCKNKQGLSKRIGQAVDYIEKHYAKELTAESIAETVHLSGDHLRHLFKEEVGVTVLDYLTNVRINHAKRLLAERKFKIYEIAEMVGYGSGQYFSQVFRRTTGVTPNNYVDQQGEHHIEI